MIQIKGPRRSRRGMHVRILIALFYLWFGRHLPVGSSSFMEAGYFPRLAALALALLGMEIAISALAIDGPGLAAWAWRPLLVLTGCIVLFGLIITRAGLVLTTVLVVVAMSFAGEHLNSASTRGVCRRARRLHGRAVPFGLGLAIPVWPQ